MNIINKALLKIALLPKSIYQRLGVDTFHLETILETKLIIDDRRPNTLHQTQRNKQEKPVSAATLGTIFVSAVLGLVYLVAFFFVEDIITQLTFYFSFFFLMLSASLITDFTAVLMDVRDNFIILPKPVNDKTVVVARILHIFIHVCKLMVPMSLPGLVYIIYAYGILGGIVFLFMVLLLTLFSIFFINALYIIVLKITTPQKFQSIISYVQIIFAIAIYASYQVLPRVMAQLEGLRADASSNPFIMLLPSYWFACGWNVLTSFNGKIIEFVATALSIVIPLLSIFIVVKILAPYFNNRLSMINSAGSENTKKNEVKTLKSNSAYTGFLSKLFSKTAPEKMGFLFAWKMTGRSRDFKMKVYPGIGYLLVYIFILFFNSKKLTIENLQDEVAKGTTWSKGMVLSLLYFGSFLLMMALNQIVYSEKFKAAWIFFIAPVKKPGEIISGGIKATIFKFYIPVAVFVTIAGLYIAGISILPNIILGLFNTLLITVIIVYMNKRCLPFSLFESNAAKSGSFIRTISTMLIAGIIALLHFIVYDFTIVIIVLAVLSIIATWLIMDSIRNTQWEKLVIEMNKEN